MSSFRGTTQRAEASGDEQLTLFDPGIDLSEVRCAREEILRHCQANNTVRGYRVSWQTFAQWCADAGRRAEPASADTVSLFVTWAATKRKPRPYKLTNVRHICCAIADHHRALRLANPVTTLVKESLAGIARSIAQPSGAKKAITPAELRAVLSLMDDNSALVYRDRAILLVGFATGWRSAELAALDLREVSIFETYMRLFLRRSKTDQLGQGREVKIPRGSCGLCPIAALEAWLGVRGCEQGPLFLPFRGSNPNAENRRIHPDLVCHVVKRRLLKAGVNPDRYGAHSLRAGMVTAATENGADLISIAERTGHRGLDMLARYVRSHGGFGRDPLAGVL
jgi:integrase